MRSQLIDFLKKELIGPDPIAPYIQSNGEEILLNEPPRLRYGAGILFPQAAIISKIDVTDDIEKEILEKATEAEEIPDSDIKIAQDFSRNARDDAEANDDTLNLANAFLPSAMGISCFINIPKEGFIVKISAGRYKLNDIKIADKEENPVSHRAYLRESLDSEIDIPKSELPSGSACSKEFQLMKNDEPTGLIINIRNRTPKKKFGELNQLYTFTLINRRTSSGSHIDNEDCFFQAGFKIQAKDNSPCFLPYPMKRNISEHEDDRAKRLLYRNHKTYAIGHGCSPAWINKDNNAIEIRTEILPIFEMKTIAPAGFKDLHLRMYDLSDYGKNDQLLSPLLKLCEKYNDWINLQEAIAKKELSGELLEIALFHIKRCKRCLSRIREGIDLIATDHTIRRAFALMNRAMLLQQLRYGLKLRPWKIKQDKSLEIEKIEYPDIHQPKTWPDCSENDPINKKYGSWYIFQIAFILMNIKSIALPGSDDRKIVDLIWFPTGGGKTEAYLGLAAFTIFLKRLRNINDNGTTVLMRYTLRLLTAQQFQRAASLICACEKIREEFHTELGIERITAGLWVGEGLTPNTRSRAVSEFNKMNQGSSKENPFVLLKCPWCGAQMGIVTNDSQHRVRGYKHCHNPSTIVFQCHNDDCDFSAEQAHPDIFHC